MKTDRRAPAPAPAYRHICELAADLARQADPGICRELIDLIHRPAHVSPPEEPLRFFMGWAARVREAAAAILRERLAAMPRPKLPRRRRVRPNPFRGRTWTRRPLKHAHPPPRRRNFLPPSLCPRAAAPPRRLPGDSARRPGRRAPESIAFDVSIFDN